MTYASKWLYATYKESSTELMCACEKWFVIKFLASKFSRIILMSYIIYGEEWELKWWKYGTYNIVDTLHLRKK